VGASPRSSASIKRSRAPRALPYSPHSIFSLAFTPRRPQPSHGRAPPATVRTSARNAVPESRSSPFEVAVSFAVLPSFPLCFQFGISWPFGALFASVRELWPPTMAPIASASSSGRRDGLGEFPSSPAFSRCLRISEPWPLAPEPRAPACPCRWPWLRRRGCHCAGRRRPFLSPSHLFRAVRS